jgi:hypothetical protein|uniref:NET domain-containing protein n=1 Tax=viral metagenome TaxID=1070528 RepID=A0A6C0C1C8_9ZZZZ
MNDSINLENLRNSIEKLDKVHHVNILKILNKNEVNYSENNNGIFINLTKIDEITLSDINNYVKYVKLQELELDDIEDKKNNIKKEFYKDNKELALY